MATRQEGANIGFIAAIVAVATIGGLLFGYDSGAVNGTQDGLKATFALSDSGPGFANYLIAQSFPVMAAGLGLAASYSFWRAR